MSQQMVRLCEKGVRDGIFLARVLCLDSLVWYLMHDCSLVSGRQGTRLAEKILA